MGYISVLTPCVRCKQPFTCSPTKVPSIRVGGKGPREPVCPECFEVLNNLRVEMGLPKWTLPKGAYEADDENEVPWDEANY